MTIDKDTMDLVMSHPGKNVRVTFNDAYPEVMKGSQFVENMLTDRVFAFHATGYEFLG